MKRWSVKEKTKKDIGCPYLIKQYNSGMGGVDLADQNVATYRLSLKTNRWYRKLLYWFIDLSVSNAWACFKVDFPTTDLDFLNFKVTIAQQLMMNLTLPDPADVQGLAPPVSMTYVPDSVRLNNMSHWPEWIGGTGENAKFGRHCRMKKCKARVRSYCSKCRVYLCSFYKKSCFVKWHTVTRI